MRRRKKRLGGRTVRPPRPPRRGSRRRRPRAPRAAAAAFSSAAPRERRLPGLPRPSRRLLLRSSRRGPSGRLVLRSAGLVVLDREGLRDVAGDAHGGEVPGGARDGGGAQVRARGQIARRHGGDVRDEDAGDLRVHRAHGGLQRRGKRAFDASRGEEQRERQADEADDERGGGDARRRARERHRAKVRIQERQAEGDARERGAAVRGGGRGGRREGRGRGRGRGGGAGEGVAVAKAGGRSDGGSLEASAGGGAARRRGRVRADDTDARAKGRRATAAGRRGPRVGQGDAPSPAAAENGERSVAIGRRPRARRCEGAPRKSWRPGCDRCPVSHHEHCCSSRLNSSRAGGHGDPPALRRFLERCGLFAGCDFPRS